MSSPTENSSNEPDPASPRWRQRLARLWNSGIPLWQKLVVWAGAAGVTLTTVSVLALAWRLQEGIMPVEPVPPASAARIFGWFATSLVLSAGLWIWPLSRGRWRIVALVLAFLTTLEFLIFLAFLIVLASDVEGYPDDIAGLALVMFIPMLAYPALAVIWTRAILDCRASRRARPASREN